MTSKRERPYEVSKSSSKRRVITCAVDGCSAKGKDKCPWVYKGEDMDRYCTGHKAEGMVRYGFAICYLLWCTAHASFGFKGDSLPTCCKTHRAEGMVNVVSPRCPKCGKVACYGVKGTKKATHCEKHGKELDMVNVTDPKCPKCGTRACYGIKGTKKATHCEKHGKELDMVNVKSPKCPKCGTQACYGVEGTKKATHCETHGKERGMVNVVSPRCPKCGKVACYGVQGTKKATHCEKHGKELDMVDVKNPKCKAPECDTQASYGVQGTKNATHCEEHGKELDMVNVKSPQCPTCGTRACYGVEGTKKATHCEEHGKELGMVNVTDPKCPKCGKVACYGVKGTKKATHCEEHGKELDMVNVKSPRCNAPECDTLAHRGYDMYCHACFCRKFPKDSRAILHLKKETLVDSLLVSMGYEFSRNRIIQCASGNRRPDFLMFLGSYYVHVECDEHGHRGRDQADERLREAELHNALGMPGWLVRINPDKCGQYPPMLSRKGFKRNEPEIERRAHIIRAALAQCMAGPPPDDEHSIISLFMAD
jgi:hypothetical protein